MSHTRISIRPAAPADIPLILTLIRELAEYEKAPEQAVATEASLRRHLFGEGLGRGPVAECIIGALDGQPQGFALFFMNFSTWTGLPGLYLEDLFVRPAARGHGLGKALFLHLARTAVERGCGRFEWAVLDWNTPAIEFYRRMGATAMDEWTVYRLSGAPLAALASRGRSGVAAPGGEPVGDHACG
jgi:GNAT superfamily N-acetyltransferase